MTNVIATKIRILSTFLALTTLAIVIPATYAQDPTAATTADPTITTEELALLVKPLTADELVVEADAWLAMLRAKVAEISQKRIEIKRQNQQAATPPPGADTAAAAPAEEKTSLLEQVNKLSEERIALTDRLNVVLNELELKGGDPANYTKYVAAVSGLQVDVSDATATWTTIQGWCTSKEGGIRWGTNLIWAIVALLVFWILGRLAARAVRKALTMSKNTSDLLTTFMTNLVRRIVLLAGVLVALSIMEVKLSPVLAIIGGAAFVIAFALQGTLSNFASGLLILAYRPYDIGDVIKAGGVLGTVESMNLVSTHIKTFDNQRIFVPNNAVWGSDITNVTGLPTRRVDMVFGISYADDTDRATQILEEIVKKHALVLDDPAPVIKLHELADSSVNFICRPWSKTADYWDVYWDVTKAVKQRFDAEGISIPFPQRDVHLYQEAKA